MTLFRVPLTDDLWWQFIAWYQLRNVPKTEWPVKPSIGAWVALENGTLIAGACLYPTDGPFVVCEFLATNPSESISRRVTHAAVQICAASLKEYAATTGKNVILFASLPGVHATIERHGFAPLETPAFICTPYIRLDPAEEQAPEAHDVYQKEDVLEEGGGPVEDAVRREAPPKSTPITAPVNRRAKRGDPQV